MGFGELAITEEKLRELDAEGWELYHVAEDFAETKNVAQQHRDKLIEMIAHLVRGGRQVRRAADRQPRHRCASPRSDRSSRRDRERYVYYPGTSAVSNKIAPRVLNRPHSITATVEITDGAEGVLVAQGGIAGGYALYVKDHKLHYAYNYLGVSSSTSLPTRRSRRAVTSCASSSSRPGKPTSLTARASPARAQLYIDGKLAGAGDLPVTIPLDIGITEGLTCGRDDGSAVTTDYEAPFAFTGTLEQVVVDVSGDLIEDKSADALGDGAPVGARPDVAGCTPGPEPPPSATRRRRNLGRFRGLRLGCGKQQRDLDAQLPGGRRHGVGTEDVGASTASR